MLCEVLSLYVDCRDGKPWLPHHSLVFRLLGVLLSVASSFSLAIADPFENPVKVVDCLPRKKMHIYVNISRYSFTGLTDLEEPTSGCPRGPWAPG